MLSLVSYLNKKIHVDLHEVLISFLFLKTW
jgi:hypothetical protein